MPGESENPLWVKGLLPKHGDRLDHESATWQGAFGRRHALNTPGPFYAAETDTCCCGPAEAPSNVLYDEQGEEFVWRQPRDAGEVRAVARAAESDPFSGYGRDGDDQWTPELVRGWWAGLPHEADRIERARHAPEVMGDAAMDAVVAEARREWLRYLRSTEIKTDLRRYIFRLEQGRYPAPTDQLPDL